MLSLCHRRPEVSFNWLPSEIQRDFPREGNGEKSRLRTLFPPCFFSTRAPTVSQQHCLALINKPERAGEMAHNHNKIRQRSRGIRTGRRSRPNRTLQKPCLPLSGIPRRVMRYVLTVSFWEFGILVLPLWAVSEGRSLETRAGCLWLHPMNLLQLWLCGDPAGPLKESLHLRLVYLGTLTQRQSPTGLRWERETVYAVAVEMRT